MMDPHFEVILERVRQLTEKTRMVVWFETHTALDGSPVMVLINEKNNIGVFNVTYDDSVKVEGVPLGMLYSAKLTKKNYDKLLTDKLDMKLYQATRKRGVISPPELVRWVTGTT
jgi:hypothetical protein